MSHQGHFQIWARSVCDMDPPLDASSEEEGEFASAEESVGPSIDQDRGTENASLMEHPQLGHQMSDKLNLRKLSRRCSKLARRLQAELGAAAAH